jgi:RNA polymerase sigma-70 factor (ECF subfamily)
MEKDLKIWERIKNGDASAMKVLHDRYYYQLYLYARKISNQPSVLDEAVSDCFIKLWTRRNELLIERSVKSYLFLMLRNGLIDRLRSKKHSVHFEDGAIPDLPDEEMHNELDRYASLYNAINKLPDQRRRILEMAVFESCTYAQIAENLNISVNTVKTQIGRAYRFLKEELDPKSMQLFLMVNSSGRQIQAVNN